MLLPIGHSKDIKEEYDSIELILENLAYLEHHWYICVDLEMVNIWANKAILQNMSFLCMWDSRAKSEC